VTLYRDATANDHRFIIGTWLDNYKNAHYAGLIASEDWYAVMSPQLHKLLGRPGTRAIVAFEPPAFLYGFIVGDTSGSMPIVHYVYIKDPYRSEPGPDGRRSGPRYARGLFAALGVDPSREFLYTCRTIACVRLADKIPLARFSPGAARYANYLEHNRSSNDGQR